MSVRFIVGSSGQGKTTQIIDEVITRSKEKPEKKYSQSMKMNSRFLKKVLKKVVSLMN